MSISFSVSAEEYPLLQQVVERAVAVCKEAGIAYASDGDHRLTIEMDLCATHANGCPLDFKKLLASSGFDFAHDLFGIRNHLNRETGCLERCFLPRCAR